MSSGFINALPLGNRSRCLFSIVYADQLGVDSSFRALGFPKITRKVPFFRSSVLDQDSHELWRAFVSLDWSVVSPVDIDAICAFKFDSSDPWDTPLVVKASGTRYTNWYLQTVAIFVEAHIALTGTWAML